MAPNGWLVIGAKDEGSEKYLRGLTVGVVRLTVSFSSPNRSKRSRKGGNLLRARCNHVIRRCDAESQRHSVRQYSANSQWERSLMADIIGHIGLREHIGGYFLVEERLSGASLEFGAVAPKH